MLKPILSLLLLGTGLLAGCGAKEDTPADAAADASLPAAVYGAARETAPQPAAKAKGAAPAGQTPAPASAPRFGEAVLDYPDDLQMTMLAFRLTNRAPPLEDWAAEEYEVRRADEFSRAGRLRAETERLAGIYEATANVGFLRMRLSSQISQYDPDRGGYYLTTFAPGSTYNFSGREKVIIQIDNAREAYFWPMDAEAAQSVLQHTSRNVTIDARIRVTGTERRTSGLVLKGRLADYAIFSNRYNDSRQLAEFSLE